MQYLLKHKLLQFVFYVLINIAFVGKIILYLSKCTAKQQLMLYGMSNRVLR
jgi:hypothetical protein